MNDVSGPTGLPVGFKESRESLEMNYPYLIYTIALALGGFCLLVVVLLMSHIRNDDKNKERIQELERRCYEKVVPDNLATTVPGSLQK